MYWDKYIFFYQNGGIRKFQDSQLQWNAVDVFSFCKKVEDKVDNLLCQKHVKHVKESTPAEEIITAECFIRNIIRSTGSGGLTAAMMYI